MSGHPFLDERSVDRLYRDADRLRRRSTALKAAKVRGASPTAVLAELSRRHARRAPRVLEVGCGRGGALERLLPTLEPSRTVAVDRSPAMLAATAARCGGALECVEADFHRLPFAAGSFDVVIAAFCLYHSPRPADACAELARCLDRRGIVIVATKSRDSYSDLDAAVAAAALDPDAEAAPSLYTALHSGNLAVTVGMALDVVEERHDAHRFVFVTPEAAAEYVVTVPKYRGCGDRDQVRSALAERWPARGLAMTSTVSYAVGRRR